MLAYLIDYIPVEILIGLGIGLLGGFIAAIFFPIRLNHRPQSATDITAFAFMLLVLLLPLIFPATMFLMMVLAFFTVWLVIPFVLGLGKPKKKQQPIIPEEVEEAVVSVSPEGRAAVLDQMGIIPYS
jgi:membrane protein implicated in regulation of membrane protease activity